MKAQCRIDDVNLEFDLTRGYDISIPYINGGKGPNCFYAPPFEAAPLVHGDFIGSTSHGSPVNFYNVRINPHGNGTHTECVGHISNEKVYIKDVKPRRPFVVQLISVLPHILDNGDRVIMTESIVDSVAAGIEGLVVRTVPNSIDKLVRMYSGTNPPYFDVRTIQKIVNLNIDHLLTDLPSIDREEDGGQLLGHKTFWDYPQTLNTNKTITEMIYAHDGIEDGIYLCSLNVVNFELDAAPCSVYLYPICNK